MQLLFLKCENNQPKKPNQTKTKTETHTIQKLIRVN